MKEYWKQLLINIPVSLQDSDLMLATRRPIDQFLVWLSNVGDAFDWRRQHSNVSSPSPFFKGLIHSLPSFIGLLFADRFPTETRNDVDFVGILIERIQHLLQEPSTSLAPQKAQPFNFELDVIDAINVSLQENNRIGPFSVCHFGAAIDGICECLLSEYI